MRVKDVAHLMKSTILQVILISVLSVGCVSRDYSTLPSIMEGHQVTMVVEISAGTSVKIEYNALKREFLPDSIAGRVRFVDYLPYPLNYGFIPSTLQSAQRGGDGDPLDVMLLGQSLPTGTIIKVIPVAVLRTKDNGEDDDKILVIPADPSSRIVMADDFASLNMNYPSILAQLESWFLNYKGTGVITSDGWGDEAEAWAKILECRTDIK